MTRAESCLFLTASLDFPAATEEAAEDNSAGGEYTAESVMEGLARLKVVLQDRGTVASFTDLLIPAMVPDTDEKPPFSVEIIPALSREELRALTAGLSSNKSGAGLMEEAAEAAAPFYAAAEVITTPPPALTVIPASGLQHGEADDRISVGSDMKERDAATLGQLDLFAEMDTGSAVIRHSAGDRISVAGDTGGKADHDSPIDRILSRAGLEAADFGTIVHGFLEDHFRGADPQIPPRIQARLEEPDLARIHEAAEDMAQGFLSSGIGKLCLGAAYRESEFPLITLVETGTNREVNEVDRGSTGTNREVNEVGRGSTGAGKIPITGQIDLLFEWEGIMHIVDFKTDRVEQPEQHFGQLAVYQRAVSDIFEKPVRSWLFYLRNSNTVEVTENVRDIDIEAMAEAYAGASRE
jgi:hypothetical protein